MGGRVSLHGGTLLHGGSGGPRASATAVQHLNTLFAALLANPKVSIQRLEALLLQIPKNENILSVHDESGYNILQKCVGLNRVELVKWFLTRHNLDVNRTPCSLPLHIACLKGYEECVELLLRHGARIDTEARMCFPGSHQYSCEEYGKTSISDGGIPSNQGSKLQSAIYYAIDGDQINIMNMLAQKMEKPWVLFRTRKPLLHIACERAAWKCVQHLVIIFMIHRNVNVRSDELHMIKDENFPIHLAVLHDLKFLELLINHGAETCVKTCTQQMTLLHIVLLIAKKSAEETLNILKFLLDHGCKEVINAPDSLGNTPLHALIVRYALEEARYGCNRWNKWDVLNIARHLLQAGASLSINQPGNSALASTLRHVRDWDVSYELLNMMLAHGGEPNNVGRDGSVPIMVCLVPLINKDPFHKFTHTMKVCYLNCIRILLKYGASPNCSYRYNLTPLHVLIFSISENITLNCGKKKKSNFEFIKDLLVLLLQHGLDCNMKVLKQAQHILQSCADMVQNVRSVEDMSCIYQLILTLMQYGADPDTQLSGQNFVSVLYVQDDLVPDSRMYLTSNENSEHRNSSRKSAKNSILYYYISLITKKEYILTDPNMNFAKIIYLFYFTMEHKQLYACLKCLYMQYIAQVPAKSTENLVMLIKDLYRQPRTLKQIARYEIYKCISKKPAFNVNKLKLPSSLKEYILNFEL